MCSNGKEPTVLYDLVSFYWVSLITGLLITGLDWTGLDWTGLDSGTPKICFYALWYAILP